MILLLAAALLAAGNAGAAEPASRPKSMNLAFVLLAEPKLPAGDAVVSAFDTFALKGQRLRVQASKGGKPGSAQGLELELGTGGTAVISLMPAPVPKGEAEEAARYSVSALNGRWKLPRHGAHLIVVAHQAGPAVERLSAFTSLLAAVSRASGAVGVYSGQAGATHDPKFLQDIAKERDAMARMVLWTGVAIAREPDGRYSLLSLGMGQLELPDLLLIVPKAKADEGISALFDLLSTAVTLGKPLPEGDTVGRDATERLPVHYVPSPADPKVKVWRVELK